MTTYPEKRGGKLTGRWYGELKRSDVERFRRPFASKQLADAYVAHVRAYGTEPEWALDIEGETSGLTFAKVAAECKAKGGPRRAAWKRERDHNRIRRLEYVVHLIGNVLIEKVDRNVLHRIVDDLEKRPVNGHPRSPGTINRYLTLASAVLQYAAEAGYITAKPAVPWQQEDGERIVVITEDQEQAIRAELLRRGLHLYELCVRVLVETGMRCGELMSLKPEQVENGKIQLHGTDTKTNASRPVYLDPQVCDELRAMLRADALPNPSLLRRRFQDCAKAVGNDEDICLHTLRHTCATRLLQRGVDVRIVMRCLGHKSINTTLKYTHVHDDDVAQAFKKLSHGRGYEGQKAEILPFPKIDKPA